MVSKKIIYIFISKYLEPIQQLVQTAHICFELGRSIKYSKEKYKIIILGMRSEAKLKEIAKELKAIDIEYVKFTEPDLDNQLTAIATIPLPPDKDYFFKNYRLLQL